MKNVPPRSMFSAPKDWFQKIRTWLRLQKLEQKLRSSRRFQKHCQALNCRNLAELEQNYQQTLLRRIGEVKQQDE